MVLGVMLSPEGVTAIDVGGSVGAKIADAASRNLCFKRPSAVALSCGSSWKQDLTKSNSKASSGG